MFNWKIEGRRWQQKENQKNRIVMLINSFLHYFFVFLIHSHLFQHERLKK